MKRRFVRRAVYPSSHSQWFRGKWPTPIKKTIYQHWRERFPFNLGCWLAPKLFFAKNLIIQQCVLASPCFLPPGNLDSFNGENIFAPGLARADITADWESPFLLVTDAPEEEVPKTSEDGESAYLFDLRELKLIATMLVHSRICKHCMFRFLKFGSHWFHILDFFTPKKWSWIAGHTSQSLSGPRLVEAKGPQQLPGLQLRPPAVDDHGNLVNMIMDRIFQVLSMAVNLSLHICICIYVPYTQW